jgi:hypothetical protein
MRPFILICLTILSTLAAGRGTAARQPVPPQTDRLLSLTSAVVVVSSQATARERKAAQVLVDEVLKRTLVRLPIETAWPGPARAAIAIGRVGALPTGVPAGATTDLRRPGREGYQIAVIGAEAAPQVIVAGADERGVLFGVGRLLRELRMDRTIVQIPAGWRLTATPAVALRGHQLGYRPKANSYDGWTVAMWDQYIRDLAVFGCNAIELIPPRSDDAADSPHFPLPKLDMMIEMSRLADEYGLDVWVWYPALDKDYGDPADVQRALNEWAQVFEKLPRLDAILVPGGDPGHTEPRHMFALLEKQTASLRRFHPKATMWLSPQGFPTPWMDEFYGLMAQEPTWLAGLAFGPQVRDPLPVLREKIDARYAIRRYPDITHSLRSQYPVPDWDVAYALTAGREPINPRPVDETAIYRALDRYAIGFIAYSEGCNDDVNKMIWANLGWNRDVEPIETLRQYARYFIGAPYAEDFAQGLLALERNWRGPLAANGGVEDTLRRFQEMEQSAPPRLLLNWRFQQVLYRAYYDAYVRRRLIEEDGFEEAAMRALADARSSGAIQAIDSAEAALHRADRDPMEGPLRRRIEVLGEALFQSIRMQLAVKPYGAIGVSRGATLDTVDAPLNDRRWLTDRFREIRALSTEQDRLAAIDAIVNWTDPGPGGFYDDLGNPSRQPHLLRGAGFASDPGGFASAVTGFSYRPGWRLSWITHAESFYDGQVQMKYEGLDSTARYRVRVVYAGEVDEDTKKLRLVADDAYEVHPWISKSAQPTPLEFDVPREATADGVLTLTWRQEPGAGGSGRGNQIAEVWLLQGT